MSATLAIPEPHAANRAVANPWFRRGGRGAAVLASGIGAFLIGGAFALVQQPAHAALAAVLGIVALATAFVAPRVATLVAVFVLLTFLADRAPGVAGRQAAPAIVFVLLAAAALRRAYDGRPIVVPRDAAWIAAYMIGLAITVAAAGDRATATESFVDALGFAAFVVVLLVRIDSEQWVRRFIWSIVAALGLVAALAVLQQVGHLYANDFGGLARVESDAGVMRSAGPLSANYFGQMLAVGAALAGYLALAARSRGERAVALCTLGIMVVALGYTYSRGAILGFLTAAVVAVFLRHVRASVVVALAVVMVLITVFVLPPEVARRIGSLRELGTPTSESDSSLRGRASENLAALDMWRAHPIVGVGPANFEQHYLDYSSQIGIDPRAEERSAHSLYLESLAETGLIGSVPFFALIGLALIRPWQARRRGRGDAAILAEGVFVALVAFLVTALTLHATFVRNMWIVLALGLVAGRLVPAASQSDPKPALR